MKTSDEIRSDNEYNISTNFTNSTSNITEFLNWFDPIAYFQDICDEQSYDSYDLDKFTDDVYESYNNFFYNFYTEKYLNKSDSEIIEMWGSMDDMDDIDIEDIIGPYDLQEWWSEVQDDFDANDYKID